MKKPDNVAYIDGANLYNGVKNQEWLLDYKKFRIWLNDKFKVKSAYLFIGNDPKQSSLYLALQEYGYILVFKPTVIDVNGKIKGNCDADMVLQIVKDSYEKNVSAVLVTSDGDFYSTVEFLQEKNKITRLVSPSPKCSILLKRTNVAITYLDEIKPRVKLKKPPVKTKRHKGLSRGNIK